MTELSIRPDEIRGALEEFVRSYDPGAASKEEVGYVISAADGVAPRRGPALDDGERVADLPGRDRRARAEPGHPGDRRDRPRRLRRPRGGPDRQAHRGDPLGAGGRQLPRPRGRPQRRAAGRAGRHRGRGAASPRGAGAVGHAAPERPRADADRYQGHRCDDPDRSGTAAAHHRRSPDGQDGHRAGHDHQPASELGVRGPEEAGPLHLRRHRPEGVDDLRGAPVPRGQTTPSSTRRSSRPPPTPPPGSSTSPPTPARRSASTGCTPASTS